MTAPLGNANARARLRGAREAVDALISAESLDIATIYRLSTRESYAPVADTLQRLLSCGPLVQIVLGAPPRLAPSRLA
jgi:hypothetical protein